MVRARLRRLERLLNPRPSFHPGIIREHDGAFWVWSGEERLRFKTLNDAKEFLREKQGANHFFVITCVESRQTEEQQEEQHRNTETEGLSEHERMEL